VTVRTCAAAISCSGLLGAALERLPPRLLSGRQLDRHRLPGLWLEAPQGFISCRQGVAFVSSGKDLTCDPHGGHRLCWLLVPMRWVCLRAAGALRQGGAGDSDDRRFLLPAPKAISRRRPETRCGCARQRCTASITGPSSAGPSGKKTLGLLDLPWLLGSVTSHAFDPDQRPSAGGSWESADLLQGGSPRIGNCCGPLAGCLLGPQACLKWRASRLLVHEGSQGRGSSDSSSRSCSRTSMRSR